MRRVEYPKAGEWENLMSFAANIQNRFAVMVAVLALLVALAIAALASEDCPEVDDYGVCVPDWGAQPAPDAPGADDILDLLGG